MHDQLKDTDKHVFAFLTYFTYSFNNITPAFLRSKISYIVRQKKCSQKYLYYENSEFNCVFCIVGMYWHVLKDCEQESLNCFVGTYVEFPNRQ